MRRLLALFLLVLMPLQFSFAAAAAYCVDEKPEAAAHFGHHQCGNAQQPPSADTDHPPAADNDCGICHLVGAKVQCPVIAAGMSPHISPPAVSPTHSSPQHAPEPSDRPPISPLA